MTPAFRDRAVLIGETLVVADLHLGRAETSAVEAPVGDGQDICERLASLSSALDPETVVLAGDVLHAFESVPRGVAETLSEIDRRISDGTEIVIVTGNHDTMLDRVWDGPTNDSHWIDAETLVVHGHERPAVEADRYVLGHDHPTIKIEGQRHPCFLQGAGGPDGSTVLVLPAFNRFTAGVVINQLHADEFQSPLVVDTDVLEPVVRDGTGETLQFPQLGAFRDRLPSR
jgi:putative SbcD/Mre11-related phosphoesterase